MCSSKEQRGRDSRAAVGLRNFLVPLEKSAAFSVPCLFMSLVQTPRRSRYFKPLSAFGFPEALSLCSWPREA